MSDSSSETGSEELSSLPELGIVKASPFKSDIIEVLVGPNEERFHVHQDTTCSASPFFRRCLGTDMKKASTKVVKLPEDDPESFQCILKWVYTRFIEKPLDEHYDDARRLYQAYLLADKLCMEVLCNLLMDIILEWHQAMYSIANLLQEIPDFVLKEFLVAQLAWDIRMGAIWNDESSRKSLEEFFQTGGPDVVRAMSASGKSAYAEDDNQPCHEPHLQVPQTHRDGEVQDDDGDEELSD